ncbi:MAG: hypothetical protein ACLR4Z_04265 [Butyricicoccaceae bacterium]
MAARKTTKPKSETSAPRTRKKAEPTPEVQESAGLSRAAWGAIWAGLGVLALLALLPIDGASLRWLHRSSAASSAAAACFCRLRCLR